MTGYPQVPVPRVHQVNWNRLAGAKPGSSNFRGILAS